MPNDFEFLLADARKIHRETSARFDAAWNCFDFRDVAEITSADAAQDLLTRFCWHVEQYLLGLPRHQHTTYPSEDADFGWKRCVSHLHDAMGPSGPNACIDRMRSGADGGAAAVLRELGQHVTGSSVRNQIRCMISAYWDDLALEEKLTAPVKFISQYKAILPHDLVDDGGWRIRANFPAFLEMHLAAMQRLGRINVAR
jgi:hypothetical protein